MSISLLPLTAIIVFAMKYAATYAAAKARSADEAALRSLAEQAASGQARTAESLTKIESELAQLARSVTTIEIMLKQVG